ncbi:type VI secretion system protein TssA [Pseudomonas gingeri]|uniref:Type VI secretion system protein TssA n=1 Tax=Pseudomonas gingeri TaxID=117681 RepID=A0A7Y7WLE3_9PSED|nr:type VI secretion system protein TssA [Pseudomonas gingeri]NWB83421.1 type VI secretion system protein TssA [Pseudomonas gingeri]
MTCPSVLQSYCFELASVPVFVDNFAGDDVRFSGEYESLERELGKALSPYATDGVDWHKVKVESEVILRHHSKDLRVACWMTWALYKQAAFPGLLAGLELVGHLCEYHWPVLHPLKPRTRSAAIGWLIAQIEKALEGECREVEQASVLTALAARLNELDKLLDERLAGEAPQISSIARRLSGWANRPSARRSESSQATGMNAQAPSAASGSSTHGVRIDGEKEAQKSLRLQQELARPLCAWWLRQKAATAKALGLSRTLLWLPIERLPEHDGEQVTALRAPPLDTLRIYAEALARGDHEALLPKLEATLAGAPFWFDGLRMLWECLQALSLSQAVRELELHFALFLERLPGIAELRFHDGAPFADGATRGWISSRVLLHLRPAVAPSARDGVPVDAAWEQALQDVQPVLLKDGFKSAVQLLTKGMQAARGQRAVFFWQLALVKLCFQARQYELARLKLDALDQQLQASGLQTWEPDLAAEVLHLLYQCFEALPETTDTQEDRARAYRRLCHLNLDAVII